MQIVYGTLSNCCQTSVSPINGTEKKPFHYECNKCGNDCKAISTPLWKLTPKNKYRQLTNTEKETYKNLATQL